MSDREYLYTVDEVALEPLVHMPIKVKPFEHQIRGYNLALKIMGVIK